MNNNEKLGAGGVAAIAGAVAFCALLAIGVIVGIWLMFGVAGRWQDRAHRNQARQQALRDSKNQVLINQVRIGYFKQELQIAKQQANIRQAKAVGIREAQDKIAKTLTPLYVQFEMVQALQQIALSGRNNSVVFIPTGANGIPLISNANGQVGIPNRNP
jgi:hypothetical protein